MGIGGSKFLLERTWKAASGSATTFNSPGNVVIPYGRYDITVTGRGGTGPTGAPSSIDTYNPSVPGNTTYNPIVPGTTNYNPVIPGNDNYNSPNPSLGFNWNYSFSRTYTNRTNGAQSNWYFTSGGSGPNCPSGYTFYGYNAGLNAYQYDVASYSCSGPYGWPGNVSGTNPSSGGNSAGTNAPSGGNYAGGNPAVPGNANYNTATNPSPGTPTNVLGVTFPGGNAGSAASVVPTTTINRYTFLDGTTYPVTIPSGSYVTITIS